MAYTIKSRQDMSIHDMPGNQNGLNDGWNRWKKSKNKENSWGSNKEAKIEVEGVIIKALPNLVFEVQLPDDFWWQIIQGYLGGKMRVHFIKLIPWDKVLVELSPYDLTKWRIVFRKK